MFSEIPRELRVVSPESSIISPKLKDYSGKPAEYVRKRIENILPYVASILTFHDLSPTDERKGLIPTGSIVEINTAEHKDWLKLLGGSDMGCGILFASIDSPTDRSDAQSKLDTISEKISSGELWLGGGNHFIDVMVSPDGKHYVAIHTGSPRNEQEKLNEIVEQAKIHNDWEKTTEIYIEKYHEIIKSAHNNRQKILDAINEVYGLREVKYHKPHNTINIDNKKQTVTIYKGVVHITDITEKQFLPISMDEGAIYFTPGPAVGESTNFGVPHGSGKARSTHEQRADHTIDIHPKIMLPTSAKGEVSRGVAKGAYNAYKPTERHMLNIGLARYDTEADIEKFETIAHISR